MFPNTLPRTPPGVEQAEEICVGPAGPRQSVRPQPRAKPVKVTADSGAAFTRHRVAPLRRVDARARRANSRATFATNCRPPRQTTRSASRGQVATSDAGRRLGRCPVTAGRPGAPEMGTTMAVSPRPSCRPCRQWQARNCLVTGDGKPDGPRGFIPDGKPHGRYAASPAAATPRPSRDLGL